MTDSVYCVYSHTNKTNGKMYVGITCQNPEDRWANGHGYKYNTHFWRAIQKYGWDGFSHEIIASGLTKEEACEMEKQLIRDLDLMNQNEGYNQDPGGGMPPVMTGEDNPFYGNHSQSGENHPMWGKKHTSETRKKMSERHWDCSGKNNPFYGNHMFANGKSPNCKKVQNIETGEIFDAVLYAAQSVNRDRSGIRIAIHNNGTCGGYHWKYYEEDNEKPDGHPERE